MTLETSTTILVIFISITLGIFLVMSIMVLVKMMQILRSLQRITVKAEKVADSAEAVTDFVKNAAGPATIARALASIVENVSDHAKKGKGDKS